MFPHSVSSSSPELTCYRLGHVEFPLVPAPAGRDWMDEFPGRHPYKCLPLAIGNSHGWQVQLPCDLTVTWNGGPDQKDLTISTTDPEFQNWVSHIAQSNFSMGILTFHTGYLFQTNPGWNLMVTGPTNRPKINCHPLTGVVETYWLPYPFTMNYQIGQKGAVYFEKGEPIAQIMPIPANYLEGCTPRVEDLDSNPKLKEDFEMWRDHRGEFIKRLMENEEAAVRQNWQRLYFRGERPDGTTEENHTNKLRLAVPLDSSALKSA